MKTRPRWAMTFLLLGSFFMFASAGYSQGRGKRGKGGPGEKHETKENGPPGLSKRGGNLPPGLEKYKARHGGHLPPGLEKREGGESEQAESAASEKPSTGTKKASIPTKPATQASRGTMTGAPKPTAKRTSTASKTTATKKTTATTTQKRTRNLLLQPKKQQNP